MPKISVLMPAYNAEKYIRVAIESILNQTFTDFEFIIIDDCSTDNTWGIIQEFAKKDNRIVCLRNDVNSKICKTLNRGIALVKGKYIARMDADDISYLDRLEKQFSFMETNIKIGISGGSIQTCDEDMKIFGIRRYNLVNNDIRKKLFFYSPFCHASIIVRTEVINIIGGYNEYLNDAEDYDLYFRVGKIVDFGNLNDVIYKVRFSNMSSSQLRSRRQEVLTLYIRTKAVYEYGYKMNIKDKLYYFLQICSMFIIPQKYKLRLFNFLRKK